jgi:hypothetical protein
LEPIGVVSIAEAYETVGDRPPSRCGDGYLYEPKIRGRRCLDLGGGRTLGTPS